MGCTCRAPLATIISIPIPDASFTTGMAMYLVATEQHPSRRSDEHNSVEKHLYTFPRNYTYCCNILVLAGRRFTTLDRKLRILPFPQKQTMYWPPCVVNYWVLCGFHAPNHYRPKQRIPG